jgi:hypothetical protein
MATAKAEPQVGLIFRIAFLVVALLIATRGLLLAYFDYMVRIEDHHKFGEVSPEALLSLRADEKQRLTAGSMPIDKAMQLMAAQGRTSSPALAPTNSRDVAPLAGWAMMPAVVPPAMTATPPSAADAGAQPAAAAADAGTKPGRGADAGAKKAPGKRQP